MNVTPDEISFSGEFSWEILFAVPHAYKSHLNGKLLSTCSFEGAEPFYYFSDNHKVRNGRRTCGFFMTPNIKVETKRTKPIGSGSDYDLIYTHDLDISNMVFPPYKNYYSSIAKNKKIKFDNPLLVINNKSLKQERKLTYLDRIELEELTAIVESHSDHDIVYIRSASDEPASGLGWGIKGAIADRGQPYIPFADKELMRKFSNVYTDNQLMQEWSVDFNTMQLIAHSLSDKHISVAGGNAILASYFGGINVIVSKHPKTINRKVFSTDSYLKNINGSKIIGATNTSEMLKGLTYENKRP
tara:strand:+ start:264 stop:1163 length:900 start_codon:yes stop_codon:yes gene_type:complete